MTNNRINVLPSEVYNKIAAGEVVERPASALKEMVENSIDAGATRIVIEVCGGGFQLISVSDNGCGIHEDDLTAAFLKHATSKLENADDLNLVQTLGFRGEALSSISAISRIKLTTRRAQCDTGVCVTVEDGKILEKQYVSANVGTKIEVFDLFYNVPARKKFMKSDVREASDITKYVSKLILTNPNLEMQYILDGKTVYHTKGNGLGEAIFAVYGDECLKNCLPVQYESEYMRICGFVGTPDYAKPNSTYQTLSVNGRAISDKNVQGAIMQAYKPYLMSRQYPFYVLDLAIPYDMVDVNVHPRKAEVRFQNSNMVCGKFFRAVEAALKQYTQLKVDDILSVKEEVQDDDLSRFRLLKDVSEMNSGQVEDVLEITKETQQDKKQSLEEFADELERTLTVQKARRAIGLDDDTVAQPDATLTVEVQQPERILTRDLAQELLDKTRILGVAFKTYLILEMDEKVILVDQHAAHERILFDKFMEGKTGDMQQLMFPYVFTVKDDEAEFIEQNLPNILQAGIEIEPFGTNTFRICAVSTLLADTKMEDFVKYLLSSIDEFQVDDRTLIVEKIAKKACRAAIKAGHTLNEMEIKYILKSIYENKILQCPHGRPITVVLTKTQLEKMFKRIV